VPAPGRDRRRRILYVHHGGEWGGAPLSLLSLLERLDRSRFEPLVLALRPGPVVERYRAEGIETHVVPDVVDFSHTELEWYGGADLWRLPGRLARYWPSVLAWRSHLRRLNPDLVHLNSSTLAAAARAARHERIPLVWHIREPLARGYWGLRLAWLRHRIDRDATRVIAVSQHDASRLRPSPRIRVIPNAVDLTAFDRAIPRADARQRLGIAPTDRVVVMLGGVAHAKGTLVFIQALPLVRRAVLDTTFLVAGPPPPPRPANGARALARRLARVDAYARQVMAAAAAPLAGGHLRFVGVRLDIPQILAAADLLVFPSVVPHFARPIIEAGAMAKPVVASRLGGPLELVEDGITGRLVPPSDPAGLADAIVALLEDPVAATRMGEAGYARARERFDAATNAPRTFAVYDEIFR